MENVFDCYNRSGYPIPQDKFEESAKQFDYWDMIGFAEMYAETVKQQCDGKDDSTSEKDLRVCEVIASAWISVEERLPETEEHIVLFYDGRVDFGWYSFVRNVFYSGAYEREVTYWMPMPCPPVK